MISLRDDGLNDDPKDLGVYTKGPVVPSAVPTLLVEQVGNVSVSDASHEIKIEVLPGGDPIGPRRLRRNVDAQNK